MSKNGMVMIAMSGGVDSAVSAAKLIESGYDVEGLHMTNWKDDEPYCTASQDLQDAKNACKEIGIPMHHVDFSSEYRRDVFDESLEELRIGLTPNPDILCNQMIKFDSFIQHAKRPFCMLNERIKFDHLIAEYIWVWGQSDSQLFQ